MGMGVQVRSGDTLYALLRQRGVPENQLAKAAQDVARANNLTSPNDIKAGSTLVFPDSVVKTAGQSEAYQDLKAKNGPSTGKAMGALGIHGLKETGVAKPFFAIDDGVSRSYPANGKFKLDVAQEGLTDKVKGQDGKEYSLQWSFESLSAKDPSTGKSVRLGEDRANEYKQLRDEWRQEVKGTEPSDMNEYRLNWESNHTMQPAGGAGNLVSVRDSMESYMGGAHPNFGTDAATYDGRTGKQMDLREMLTPDQFKSVMDHVKKGLASPQGEPFAGVAEFIDEDTIAKHFTVFEEKGKLKFEVSFQSGVHAMAALEARFIFNATPEFKKAAGVE